MKIVRKQKKTKDTTISFRVDKPLKDEWLRFCKEHEVNQKKTITQILLEVMSNIEGLK